MKKFLVFVLLMAAIVALGYMLYPYAVEHFGQEKVLEFASKTGTNILYQDEEIKLITTMNLKEEYEIISFKIIINDEEDNYIITKNNNLLTSEKTLINTYKVSYEINIPKTISGRVSYTLDSFQYYNGETIEDYIFKEKKKLELNVSEYLFVEEVSFESLEFEADIPAIPLTLKLYDPYDLDLISIHFRTDNNDLFGEVIEKKATDEEGRFMLYLEIPTPDFPQSYSTVDLNLKITGYTFI